MDQEIEKRLARIERRVIGAVTYSSVALMWALIQPEIYDYAAKYGITHTLAGMIVAVVAAVLGVLLTRIFIKYTEN